MSVVEGVTQQRAESGANGESAALECKLWIYTNLNCNIRCTYCVAESSPQAPRHALDLETVRRLVDEAVELGFVHLLFTGGEPFILDEIYEMLAYASERVETTVLTNAMLLRGRRLDRLVAIANDNLVVQVSLDGGRPEHHDAYRGAGTWKKTVEGIRLLQERGFRVRLSTTETTANSDHLDELHQFRQSLGILEEDHFVRPLARRGFSQEGMEVGIDSLVPELTAMANGLFWHPLVSPNSADMQVSKQLFPLAAGVKCIQEQYDAILRGEGEKPQTFT